MTDASVITDLVRDALSDNEAHQLTACQHVRDLSENDDYRSAFGQAGVVVPLVGLLDSGAGDVRLAAAQALAHLAEAEPLREAVRDADGVRRLCAALRACGAGESGLRLAVLDALLALAVDEPSRVEAHAAGAVPGLVRLLDEKEDKAAAGHAAQLLGRLAYSEAAKGALRDAGGINALLRLVRGAGAGPGDAALAEVALQALTVAVVGCEVNQERVRDQYGLEPIVRCLEAKGQGGRRVAGCACDALRALCAANDANKAAVREAWGLPLLVALLGPEEDEALVERAADCLRILTAGNETNKVALLGIPAALPALVRLLGRQDATALVTAERAAAVLCNLSGVAAGFGAMREAGAIQRLVDALEAGPAARLTELAAFALANLAANEANSKNIRLAGGTMPLVRLLTERPPEQVLTAAEEALRRCGVSGVERNAVLDAFRYMEARAQRAAAAPSGASEAGASARAPADGPSTSYQAKPFTRYTVDETCGLLRGLGLPDTGAFAENGVAGGDLVALSETDLRMELRLSTLQARKIIALQRAFQDFNALQRTPGKGALTVYELTEWMTGRGYSEEEAAAVAAGLLSPSDAGGGALIPFASFALSYSWFVTTLKQMRPSSGAQANGGPELLAAASGLSSSCPSAELASCIKAQHATSDGIDKNA